MPKTILAEAFSPAAPGPLYAKLCDASSWPQWSPIERAVIEQPAEGGDIVGEVRRFETGRIRSREQIVEAVPDRRISYILLSGLPLLDYRADVELTPHGEGTAITWRSSFRPARPGTGWLYRLILRRFLQRMAEGLAGAETAAPQPEG